MNVWTLPPPTLHLLRERRPTGTQTPHGPEVPTDSCPQDTESPRHRTPPARTHRTVFRDTELPKTPSSPTHRVLQITEPCLPPPPPRTHSPWDTTHHQVRLWASQHRGAGPWSYSNTVAMEAGAAGPRVPAQRALWSRLSSARGKVVSYDTVFN